MGKNAMHGSEMHIACPNCQAIYDVPESKLNSVLSLRCSTCHHSWELRPVRPAFNPGASANRQQSTAGAGRRSQAGSGFTRASGSTSQPQPESALPMSSVTVSSVTVSSVTVSSNQPAAANIDFPPKPPMDAESAPRPAPFTPPAPAPDEEPETAPEAGTDYVVHLSSTRQSGPSNTQVRPAEPPAQSLLSLLLGCGLLVLILLTIAILTRHGLMKLFPASTAFFKALGIS